MKNKKIMIVIIAAIITLIIGIALALLLPKASDNNIESETESGECEHIFESTLVEPTKDTKGYVVNKCIKCRYSYNDKYYDAIGSEGLKYVLLSNGNLVASGIGSCTDKDIVIPEVHEGKNVTEIASEAFKSSDIKSVKIIGKLDRIGDLAFAGCKSLEVIYYGGTKAEWEALQKGTKWDIDTPKYTVQCTDGIINK